MSKIHDSSTMAMAGRIVDMRVRIGSKVTDANDAKRELDNALKHLHVEALLVIDRRRMLRHVNVQLMFPL